jgi:putative sterol carrier protein
MAGRRGWVGPQPEWGRSESPPHRFRDQSGPRVPDVGRIYADAAQLRVVFSEMFDDVADDDGMDGLVAQQMVINFRLHDPSIDIWVDGRSRPVATAFEPNGVDATLTAELSADSMHELLLGTLPLGKAVLFRRLKVSGSRSGALRLEPLLHACQAVYPGIVDRRL